MAWEADPKTGKVVNVPKGGKPEPEKAEPSPAPPSGTINLVNAQGEVYEAGAEWVERQMAAGVLKSKGWRLATDKDVSAYDEANRDAAKPILEKAVEAEHAARAAGMAGTIDAATALVRAPVSGGAALLGYDDPLQQATGRRVLENVGYLAAEAMGGSGDVTARNIQREQAYLAEKYPGATAVGEIGGQVAGSLPSMGASGALALAGRVGLGAVEGAGLGASAANEDAYLKNKALTRDQLLASVGIGALVGLVTTGGAEGLGAAARSFFQRRTGKGAAAAVDALEGEAGAAAKARELPAGAAPEPEAGPLGAYRSQPADYEGQIRAATGQEPAPGAAQGLLETVEGLQSAASGAERGTLQKYGALRNTPEAATGRNLWRNREKILEQSAQKLTSDLDELIAKRPDIFDEVVDSRLKRENIASKLGGDSAGQLAAARQELAKLRDEVRQIAGIVPEAAAAAPPPTSSGMSWLEFLKGRMGPAMKAHGGDHTAAVRALSAEYKALKAGASAPAAVDEAAAAAANEARAAAAASVEMYGNERLTKNLAKLVDDLAKRSETADAAEAFILLDQAKRALQRERVHVGRSALRQQDAFLSRQARALGDKLEEMQEGTRQLLMSEELWGAAGADQRAINAAWEDWFASRRLFERNLLTQVGETFDGRPIMRADPDKISGYLGKIGREQGALLDEQTRHHVAATQRLAGAIGEAFDLGSKKQLVADVAASANRIAGTLDHADKTIKVANQIDAVIAAEASGGPLGSVFSGAAIGTLAGGPIGTAIGAAASILTRPGSMIRTRAAVEAMARDSDHKLIQSVVGLLEGRGIRVIGAGLDAVQSGGKRVATEAAEQGAAKVAKTAAADAGTKTAMDAPARRIGGNAPAEQLPAASGRRGSKAERIARLAAVDAFAAPGESDRQAYKRRAEELAEIQRDPVGTHKRVTRAIQGTADVYPDLAAETAMAALRAHTYLAAKLPAQPTETDPLTGKPIASMVTDDDIDTFKAHWDAVRNPMSVLASAAKGQLLTEQVEALREVYPAMYERIRFVVSEQLASGKHDPPYETRLQLDLLLDLNGRGESSLSPEFQRTLAMVAETPEAGPEGAPPQGGSGRVNPRMANAYQTTATQVEAGL